MSTGSKRRRQRPVFKARDRDQKRNCRQTGKRSWHSQESALASAASLAKDKGTKTRVYLCNHCGLWHITTKAAR